MFTMYSGQSDDQIRRTCRPIQSAVWSETVLNSCINLTRIIREMHASLFTNKRHKTGDLKSLDRTYKPLHHDRYSLDNMIFYFHKPVFGICRPI